MRRKREPAPREDAAREIALDEVEITIDVVRRPGRTQLGAPRSSSAFLVVALVSAGAIWLLVASPGHDSARVARAPAHPVRAVDPKWVAARFGIRSHCVRRAIISRDGLVARVDFDRGPMCGAAGNHVTLILRRVHARWVAAFDATGWRCPAAALPRPLLRQLRLCRGSGGARLG